MFSSLFFWENILKKTSLRRIYFTTTRRSQRAEVTTTTEISSTAQKNISSLIYNIQHIFLERNESEDFMLSPLSLSHFYALLCCIYAQINALFFPDLFNVHNLVIGMEAWTRTGGRNAAENRREVRECKSWNFSRIFKWLMRGHKLCAAKKGWEFLPLQQFTGFYEFTIGTSAHTTFNLLKLSLPKTAIKQQRIENCWIIVRCVTLNEKKYEIFKYSYCSCRTLFWGVGRLKKVSLFINIVGSV